MIRIDVPVPTNCRECSFHDIVMGYCRATADKKRPEKWNERQSWCPIIPQEESK